MVYPTFDMFSRAIIYLNGSLSYLMNLILIYLITFHSRKHIGTYRYLMLLFALFNMIYPGVHIVVMPNMHVYEYAFVLFPTSFLQYTLTAAHWGMVMYGSLFCQSLVLLAFHFVYRYILICKTNYLYLFNSPKYIPIHFGIWLGMGIIWGTVLHNFMFYTEPYKNYLHDVLWETYEFDVNTSAILGLMYKKRNEDGEEVWDLLELFAFSVCMTELGITFSVISFCTWRIHETLKTAVMSEKARRLQFELFKALLVQTMIPVFFEYIPCAVTFFTPLIHFPFGRACNYVPIAISLYPILDPICIIHFIKDYRYALLTILRLRSNSSVLHLRSDQGKEPSQNRNPKPNRQQSKIHVIETHSISFDH